MSVVREKEDKEMTITIHQPVRRTRLAISLGLAAILLVAAFAISQNTDTEIGAPVALTPVESSETQQFIVRLQSLQDNYLPPTATSASAWVRIQSLQDNYLPPAVTTASAWMRLESLQDGYLPPSATEPSNSGRSDDRTGRPR